MLGGEDTEQEDDDVHDAVADVNIRQVKKLTVHRLTFQVSTWKWHYKILLNFSLKYLNIILWKFKSPWTKTCFKGSFGLALVSRSFQNNFSIFSSMRWRIWSSLRSHLRYSFSLSTIGTILLRKNCLKLSASTAKGNISARVSRLILERSRERAWNFAMFFKTTLQWFVRLSSSPFGLPCREYQHCYQEYGHKHSKKVKFIEFDLKSLNSGSRYADLLNSVHSFCFNCNLRFSNLKCCNFPGVKNTY